MYNLNDCVPINFIVSSVVYPNDEADNGRCFSKEMRKERLRETVNTIKSIRTFCSNAKIILVDGGIIDPNLTEYCDKYLWIGDKAELRKALDFGNKGYGEAILLLEASDFLDSDGFVFKLSGRYSLNDKFDLSRYMSNSFNFRVYERFSWYQRRGLHSWNEILKGSYSTRLYGVPVSKRQVWTDALLASIPLLKQGDSIEQALPRSMKKEKINFVEELGVCGYVGGREWISE